jgi:hypothetical protein
MTSDLYGFDSPQPVVKAVVRSGRVRHSRMFLAGIHSGLSIPFTEPLLSVGQL